MLTNVATRKTCLNKLIISASLTLKYFLVRSRQIDLQCAHILCTSSVMPVSMFLAFCYGASVFNDEIVLLIE